MLYSSEEPFRSEYRCFVSALIVWTKEGIVYGFADLTKVTSAGHEPKQL